MPHVLGEDLLALKSLSAEFNMISRVSRLDQYVGERSVSSYHSVTHSLNQSLTHTCLPTHSLSSWLRVCLGLMHAKARRISYIQLGLSDIPKSFVQLPSKYERLLRARAPGDTAGGPQQHSRH
jgi:hypothetical protein